MKKDLEFRIKVLEIAESRAHLYASWFPALDKSKYLEIVIEQGAEYTTMGDLFYKKYKNLCVLAFDHSKMKIFYTLNNSFPVLYGRKRLKLNIMNKYSENYSNNGPFILKLMIALCQIKI